MHSSTELMYVCQSRLQVGTLLVRHTYAYTSRDSQRILGRVVHVNILCVRECVLNSLAIGPP